MPSSVHNWKQELRKRRGGGIDHSSGITGANEAERDGPDSEVDSSSEDGPELSQEAKHLRLVRRQEKQKLRRKMRRKKRIQDFFGYTADTTQVPHTTQDPLSSTTDITDARKSAEFSERLPNGKRASDASTAAEAPCGSPSMLRALPSPTEDGSSRLAPEIYAVPVWSHLKSRHTVARHHPRFVSSAWIAFMVALFGGPAILCLGGAFFLDLREEPVEERQLRHILHEWLYSDSSVDEPPQNSLPSWVTPNFLYCTSSGLFLILGVYMTLVPLRQHTHRSSHVKIGKLICIWLSSFLTFALAITSIFTYSQTAPGGSFLGGLGNASQILVIFLSMMMVNEEAQAARTNDIPSTEYCRDIAT